MVQTNSIVPSDITRVDRPSRKLLHVGCGRSGREKTHHSFHGPEWEHVRFDIDATVQPDVVGDMRHLDAIEDESMDAVFSSHNLEHLHWNDVFDTLKSFLRVLKDRGRLVVVVPDFELACEQVVRGEGLQTLYTSAAGPITPLDMIFGMRAMTYDNPYMQHRTGFTDKWLKNVLVDQGFSSVEVVTTEGYDIWAFARKYV
jgi:predicted SAM-dependent methyltransferase